MNTACNPQVLRSVEQWESRNPVAKFGQQIAMCRPGDFRNMVTEAIIADNQDLAPGDFMAVNHGPSITEMSAGEVAEAVWDAYKHLASLNNTIYDYAALPPDADVPRLPPVAETFKPAPGYMIASLLAHLPLKSEPVESTCLVCPDGSIVGGPHVRLDEAVSFAPAGEEVSYSVVDRHGDSYRVRAGVDDLQTALVADHEDFAYRHDLSAGQLSFCYQREIQTLLVKHYGADHDAYVMSNELLQALLTDKVPTHEHASNVATQQGLIREDCVDPLARLTIEDGRAARVQLFRYLETDQVDHPVDWLEADEHNPRIRLGDVVVAHEESVVGIVTCNGIKAITENSCEFGIMGSDDAELVSPYSMSLAKEAAEYFECPMPRLTSNMRM